MRAAFLILGGMLVSAATLGSCAPNVELHTSSLTTTPFARYRTFSLGDPEGAPEGYTTSRRSEDVRRRLGPLIITVLQEKGYKLATGKGDFIVTYGSGRRNATILHPERSFDLADENHEDDFVEGSIVLDVFDGANDGQVWHGATRAGINPEMIDQSRLERSTRLLLGRYPSATVPPIDGAAAAAPVSK
jgi:hypothetical protein